MKTFVLFILKTYQVIISPLIHQLLGQKTLCRYEVSCSKFAKDAISNDGVVKGSMLAIKRFLSCQPFTKSYANI